MCFDYHFNAKFPYVKMQKFDAEPEAESAASPVFPDGASDLSGEGVLVLFEPYSVLYFLEKKLLSVNNTISVLPSSPVR